MISVFPFFTSSYYYNTTTVSLIESFVAVFLVIPGQTALQGLPDFFTGNFGLFFLFLPVLLEPKCDSIALPVSFWWTWGIPHVNNLIRYSHTLFLFPISWNPFTNNQNKSQPWIFMVKNQISGLSHNISRSLLILCYTYPLNHINVNRCVSWNLLGDSYFLPFLRIHSQTIKSNHWHMDAWGHIRYHIFPIILTGIYWHSMLTVPMSLPWKIYCGPLHIPVEG